MGNIVRSNNKTTAGTIKKNLRFLSAEKTLNINYLY